MEQWGPLKASSINKRYFARPDGSIVYLTGAHTWNNLQDRTSGSIFDFNAYVNWMSSNSYNYMRMWMWDGSQTTLNFVGTAGPFAYPRTGPGNALDGGLKYDLSQFNQAYFDRMRARVQLAAAKGIYVSIMLFDAWAEIERGAGDPYPTHPFNVANNINGVNGDANNTGSGWDLQSGKIAQVQALEQAYVLKVIDTVNDLGNVMYEISNESYAPAANQWQYNMITLIHNYEGTKAYQHPVGMTFEYSGDGSGNNAQLFNSPADYVCPGASGYTNGSTDAGGSKVVIVDTDHVFGEGGNADWVWQQFLAGNNTAYMEGLNGTGIPGADNVFIPDQPSGQLGMTETAGYAARLNLMYAVPSSSSCSNHACMINPGHQFIAQTQGSITLDLTSAGGKTLQVEWLDINAGSVLGVASVTGGSSAQVFSPPSNNSLILFVHD